MSPLLCYDWPLCMCFCTPLWGLSYLSRLNVSYHICAKLTQEFVHLFKKKKKDNPDPHILRQTCESQPLPVRKQSWPTKVSTELRGSMLPQFLVSFGQSSTEVAILYHPSGGKGRFFLGDMNCFWSFAFHCLGPRIQ